MIPKYRAWHKKEKKMYFVERISKYEDNQLLIKEKGEWYIIKYVHSVPSGHITLVSDVNGILIQSTGLKDKKGKEIFEGDIVSYLCKIGCRERSNAFVQQIMSQRGAYVYVCHDPKFDIKNTGVKLDKGWIKLTRIEVIGNIHENPELLEKKVMSYAKH